MGLPIGIDARRKSTRQPVINKVKTKDYHFRATNIYPYGVRLFSLNMLFTLYQSIYPFSKLRTVLLGILRRCLDVFLWGVRREGRGFIGWHGLIFVRRKRRVLRLKNLKAFIYALLGKWLWRLRAENNCLWEKILKEKYGGR